MTNWHRAQLIVCFIIIAVTAAACQMLPSDSPAATIEFEMTRYVTEAAEISIDSLAQQTASAATIDAAATESGFYHDYNNLLIVTVRAGDVPTPQLEVVSGPQPMVENPDAEGDTDSYQQGEANEETITGEVMISQVATAAGVRSSDGCATGRQSSFNTSTERIYLTAVATNLQAGTRFDLSWQYDGSTVHQSSWTADQNQSSLCIWFFIDPSDAPFSAGSWSASLSVNGAAAGTADFMIGGG